jgi:hypothetical protein
MSLRENTSNGIVIQPNIQSTLHVTMSQRITPCLDNIICILKESGKFGHGLLFLD